jgi:glycosyltransferase involved in cell wall biosynthesis
MGWQEQLADYFRTSDCLLLTSFSEGYGMVVAEAVLSQLPVIMTDVGCSGDLVKNNDNGLVITNNDLVMLVNAMERIKTNNILRLQLKQGCFLAYSKIFDYQKSADLVYNKWSSLIHGK